MKQKTGKIIIHIGLPKTATTTLQEDVFPKLASDNVVYLGVTQPRNETKNNYIFSLFYEEINSGKNSTELKSELNKQLHSGKTILISEEMITVSVGLNSWRSKLNNLSQIIGKFDYEIIVTVREPVSALFSYYCELYPKIPKEQRDFINCALNRDEFKIFHYGELIKELTKHFDRNKIHFIKFENIIKSDLNQLLQIIHQYPNNFPSLNISNRNQKIKNTELVKTTLKESAGSILREIIGNKKIPNWKVITPLKISIRKILKILDQIKFRRHFQIETPKPEEQLIIRESINLTTKILDEDFGIKY